MKKSVILVLLVFFSLFVVSCGRSEPDNSEINARLEESYDHGYTDGHADGFSEGVSHSLENIPKQLDSELEDLAWDLYHEFGMTASDALEILDAYQHGEDVSDQDMITAISVITKYIENVSDLIEGIEHTDIY